MFSESTGQSCNLFNIQIRNSVSKLLLIGKIGKAVKLIEESFPSLLSQYPRLLFLMRVQQFIEKILKNDDDVVDPSLFLYKVMDFVYEKKEGSDVSGHFEGENLQIEKIHNGDAALNVSLDKSTEPMEINDDNDSSYSESLVKPLVFPNISHITGAIMSATSTSGILQQPDPVSLESMKDALIFGHLLYQAGVFLYKESIISSLDYHLMMEVFGLILVEDFHSSAISHLISPTRRNHLAERVNSALLLQMGYPGVSNIDAIKSQTEQCYNVMAEFQIPITGILDISKIC